VPFAILTRSISCFVSMRPDRADLSEWPLKLLAAQVTSKLMTAVRFRSPAPSQK
jgi:hypothetical protein